MNVTQLRQQFRRAVRWQKLQRFRASPRFAHIVGRTKVMHMVWCASVRPDLVQRAADLWDEPL